MYKFLYSLMLFITIVSAETGNQMKSTIGSYDFTYGSGINTAVQNFQPETTIEKVLIMVAKQNVITRRESNIFSCKSDSYGSSYCPAALAPANRYTAYKDSTVIERTTTVTDYERGTYQEKTSYVRDFLNGTSAPHVNTETNYTNGSSNSYSGSVYDFTNKVNSLTSSSFTPTLAKPLNVGSNTIAINFNERGGESGHNNNAFTCGSVVTLNGSCVDMAGNYGSRDGWSWNANVNMYDISVPTTIEGTPVLKYNRDLVGASNSGNCSNFSRSTIEPLYNTLISSGLIINTSSVIDGSSIGSPQIIDGMCKINVKAYQATYVPNNYYYVLKGYYGTGIPYTSLGNKQVSDINLYTSEGLYYINNQLINSPSSLGEYAHVYVYIDFEYVGKLPYQPCPSTHIFFDGKCVSQTIGQACPSGYSDNGSNCKKSVTFKYYSYGCPQGFSPQNVGFTSYSKTDPDITSINDYSLDDDVNSPTPPANNCVQVLNSVAYEYLCTSGYNTITPGLTVCPAGTSGACNSSVPPAANCYKDIAYKHYTYGCSDGYITDNYGLATCTKTDPDTTRNNSDTLDDACNSPTPPDGNCRRQISYKFYEYQCTGVNSHNEPWVATNPGLTSCSKTDSNINAVNTDLGNACNSSTAPAKNCTSTEYNCGVDDGGIFLQDKMEYSNGTASKQTSSFVTYASKNTSTLLCPSGYTATTGTDRANGECRLDTTYSYYNYSCPTDTNQYGFTYTAVNVGGNCNATTLAGLMDTNSDGIGDSCNSPTPPTNNCQRKSYTPMPGINNPVFVDNIWQCSPFSCNSGMKCGYGLCPYGTTPSTTQFQSPAYNPLGAAFNGTCTGAICDYVKNTNISYCTSQGCPTGSEFINKDGNCYKSECPKGTYQSGDKCVSSNY